MAALARKHGKPVLAFAGSIAENAGVDSLFDAACAIIDEPVALDAAMSAGAEFLERAAPPRRAPSQTWKNIMKEKRIALLFAGQGAQAVGMGKDLAAKYPEAAELFTRRGCRAGVR